MLRSNTEETYQMITADVSSQVPPRKKEYLETQSLGWRPVLPQRARSVLGSTPFDARRESEHLIGPCVVTARDSSSSDLHPSALCTLAPPSVFQPDVE